MADEQKPYDAENSKAPVEESQNKQDQSGDSNASGWDGRPKYKSDTTSKFFVNDKVHLRVGSSLTGPYYIASVVRARVYTLCDANGNYVNGAAQIAESSLVRAP